MATVNAPAARPLVVREGSRDGPVVPPGTRAGRRVRGSIEIRGTDPRFPALLREVAPPPASLFCLGDTALLAGPAVSIVGSRAATRFGLRVAETLGAALAAEGVIVVSGLARGIDAAAHSGALAVGGGTVAVLAGGLDVAVPHATRPLGRRIAREGCVVTEYEAAAPPLKGRFHARNRIVAGLSRLTVVVEASGRSGALITARHALDSGREVMAVPGHPLAANSAGVNRLLREGAGVVRDAADVLAELLVLPGLAPALEARKAALAEAAAPAANDGEAGAGDEQPEGVGRGTGAGGRAGSDGSAPALRTVYEATGGSPDSAEVIARRAGLDLVATLSALTRLELGGLVRAVAGRRYLRPDREEES